jgi:hypothetical protein
MSRDATLYIVTRQRAGAVAYPVAAFDELDSAQVYAAVSDRSTCAAWHRVSAVPFNPLPFNKARMVPDDGVRALCVGAPCAGYWRHPGSDARAHWVCRCGAHNPKDCKTESSVELSQKKTPA